MMRRLASLFICLALLPAAAQALPTIECHCYQDRSYDMAKPGAADDYFLTTIQNTFFALTFDVTKKSVVKAKQQGASGADLWIAYWLADKSPRTAEDILAARIQQADWPATIAALKIDHTSLGEKFNAALTKPSAALDQVVVDDILLRLQILPASELASLRLNQASNKEVLAAALLAAKTQKQALLFLQQVQGQVATWDSLTTQNMINIKQIDQELLTTFTTLKKG